MNTNLISESPNPVNYGGTLTVMNSLQSSDQQLMEDLKFHTLSAGIELNKENERARRQLWIDTFHYCMSGSSVSTASVSQANKLAQLAVDAYDAKFSSVK